VIEIWKESVVPEFVYADARDKIIGAKIAANVESYFWQFHEGDKISNLGIMHSFLIYRSFLKRRGD
jgi:hypothetical protein